MEKKKILLIIVFLLVLIILSLILNRKSNELYEYYDLNGDYGISNECIKNTENLICLKEDKYIQVMQYSKMEE